jgi:ATP-dependent DNA ligase
MGHAIILPEFPRIHPPDFCRYPGAEGKGSVAARRDLLHDLLGRATGPEQAFLIGLLAGELRQGALDGVMADAVAAAAEVSAAVRGGPELVVEVAFDGVQRSSRYPGGMALRFARVVRYRPDKSADEADTVETVRAIAGPVLD